MKGPSCLPCTRARARLSLRKALGFESAPSGAPGLMLAPERKLRLNQRLSKQVAEQASGTIFSLACSPVILPGWPVAWLVQKQQAMQMLAPFIFARPQIIPGSLRAFVEHDQLAPHGKRARSFG